MPLLAEGQTIRDTYEVERLLGQGAFGEVYRVRHRFLGRQAMKVFKRGGMTLAETEELLGEALLLSRIGHPNIVRVFDANTIDSELGPVGFFTMEYVAGGSLEQFWRSHGSRFVPTPTVVDVISQVCRGLAVAHRESPPVVHRDIKPQNILVGYDAAGLRVRVSDFGLAKHVNPLTLLASAKGTLGFKAPEIFQDLQSDSCAGDVWAIGATMYMLLTDRLPYSDQAESGARAFDRPLTPPSRLNVLLDKQLEAVVQRSLAVRPQDRYADALELLAALDAWKANPPKLVPMNLPSTERWAESKSALGTYSPDNQAEAKAMAEKALLLARDASQLPEAADLMEEAFNKSPELRTKYDGRLQLWRRGICM